jgi:hypothetical protein
MSVYGFCPRCGAPGKFRERRPNGNDTCEQGCVYPSLDAIVQKPAAVERTQFERECIQHLSAFVNGSEHPEEGRNEVLAARILLEHFERNGLAATAHLVVSAEQLGQHMRGEE